MPTPTGVSSGAAPRLLAARAAAAVLDRGESLDARFAEYAELDEARDRALARRLVHLLMRDWPSANGLVGLLLERQPARRDRLVHFILALAVAELREAREPPHAVVHSAVEAARLGGLRHLSGLVNGVLRTYLRQADELARRLPQDAVHQYGYPAWLIEHLRRDWPQQWEQMLAAGNQAPPLWLRVNRRHWSRETARVSLAGADIEAEAPPDLEDALRLAHRVAIRDLPGFADGSLSVQDGAAQLAADYLQLEPGQRVLDACAAPGGKAAHILERADVDLTAVELDAERLVRTEATLQRLKLSARLVQGDAADPEAWWDGQGFDRILIDAPCSATGVIRRHPDIRWLRRPADINHLVELQRRLLTALWPLLKPGGILVYVTCSILKAENVRQAQHFVETHADARVVEHARLPGLAQDPGRQILPGEAGMDGFYHLAVERLRRA
ncbi:MAG: 16S rRNA (cytosine(967)-C(5))-methyltransferase RsmB [Wenzhouxiangella sp.]